MQKHTRRETPSISKILASNLRLLRGEESQKSFAARIGISQSFYGYLEHGYGTPSARTLLLISATTGETPASLLGRTDITVERV